MVLGCLNLLLIVGLRYVPEVSLEKHKFPLKEGPAGIRKGYDASSKSWHNDEARLYLEERITMGKEQLYKPRLKKPCANIFQVGDRQLKK